MASVRFIEAINIKTESKSVLGRAVFGAILLGPLGAVVGGLSGTQKKEKPVDGMEIVYWSVEQKRYNTLIFVSERVGLKSFSNLLAKTAEPHKPLHA